KTGTEFAWDGVSSEWKFKLLDPVADALGVALYAELTLSDHEFEAEAKVILDKRVGNFLFAFNAIFEDELAWFHGGSENEIHLEGDLAAAYFVTPTLSLGLELRNDNLFTDKGLEHSALFLGPVIAYSRASWWVALAVLPQLPALKGASYKGLDLD